MNHIALFLIYHMVSKRSGGLHVMQHSSRAVRLSTRVFPRSACLSLWRDAGKDY